MILINAGNLCRLVFERDRMLKWHLIFVQKIL